MSDEMYYFLSQNAAGAATAENDIRQNLGDTAGLWTIKLDALPVGYGESFEPSEGMLPPNLEEFLQNSDDTGSTYWAVKVILPAGTKPFNPAYLMLTRNGATLQLSPQFQTLSLRYIGVLTASDGA
ncbi:hypothetical protein GCM10009760_58350 [Kitasatospora kazusensis]|uniref:Uncharacterized protein n=1 Tax=Kitasatospora kazusensis TaxID=407974 RepID=A0ABN3A9I4_9ACTN